MAVVALFWEEAERNCFQLEEFSDHHMIASTVARDAAAALRLDDVEDVGDRVLQRETMFSDGLKRDMTTAFVFNVIRNIEGMKSTREWEKQDKQWKSRFVAALARYKERDEFEAIDRIDGLTKREKQKRYTKLITPCRMKLNKWMGRRQQMWLLYRRVRCHFIRSCSGLEADLLHSLARSSSWN